MTRHPLVARIFWGAFTAAGVLWCLHSLLTLPA